MTWMSYETGQPVAWHAPTQDAVAKRFAEAQAERLRYCHNAQAWFVWDGVAWRRDRIGVVTHRIRELARDCSTDPDDRPSVTAASTRFIAGIERFARGDPALAVTAEAFDADPFRLGTPGGSVDLRTGLCEAADPADGISLTSRVAPADASDCPLWQRLMDEMFGDDTDLIAYAQRLLGSMLTGGGAEPIVFAWGPGADVIRDTVAGVMGDYARMSALATLTSLDADRYSVRRANLRGARLVVATDDDGLWTGRRLDRLTVEAANGRQDRPGWTLLLTGETPPRLADSSLRRRVQLLPVARRPTDRNIAAALRAEGPAILRWMIEGCLAWQAHGLGQPKALAAAMEDALDAQDAIGDFLAERCVIDPAETTTAAALFAAWSAWADAAGEDTGSRRAFVDAMSAKRFRRQRTNTERRYVGIGVTRDA